MSDFIQNYKRIRNNIFEYQFATYPYLLTWPWFSYRKVKVIAMMNFAPVIILISKKLSILPNTLTHMYIMSAYVTVILLSVHTSWSILLSAILIVFRQFIDWADGHLARETNRKTDLGHLLDSFGGGAGFNSLILGSAIFSYKQTGNILFLYFGLISLFFLYSNTKYILKHIQLHDNSNKESREEALGKNKDPSDFINAKSIKAKLQAFLYPSARTMDLFALFFVIDFFWGTFLTGIFLGIYTVSISLSWFWDYWRIFCKRSLVEKKK